MECQLTKCDVHYDNERLGDADPVQTDCGSQITKSNSGGRNCTEIYRLREFPGLKVHE